MPYRAIASRFIVPLLLEQVDIVSVQVHGYVQAHAGDQLQPSQLDWLRIAEGGAQDRAPTISRDVAASSERPACAVSSHSGQQRGETTRAQRNLEDQPPPGHAPATPEQSQ